MKWKHYYGDLHTHTGFSDGKGTPKEAFQWAKASGKGDFLAVSDHEGSITKEKWQETLKAAREVTDETFVALAAYESGFSDEFTDEDGVSVVNGGELNVFGTDTILVESGYPTDFKDFYTKLKATRTGVAFYNHPQEASWPTDKIWNAYNDFGEYSEDVDQYIVGMETSNETSAYNHIHELVYTTALDKGWHFAPFATSDTHGGNWLSHFENRTVVVAQSLSEESIIDAFRQRRVYAVEDRFFQVEFAINGAIMGSCLNSSETNYEIEIDILHKKPESGVEFSLVEIVSDGGDVVARYEEKGFHIQWKPRIISDTATYFFVRVVNEEGKKAWTAPIWTGRKPINKKLYIKGTRIPCETMKILAVSSEKEEARAIEILNPDTKTYWETQEKSGEIIIDLGTVKNIVGIGYRKNYIAYEDREALSKLLDHFEYSVSNELEGQETIVAHGRIKNYGKEHYEGVEEIQGRYIKIRALSAVEKGTVAIGNIYIYE